MNAIEVRPQPNPTRRACVIASPERAARFRKLDCARYDECLRKTGQRAPGAQQGWISFDCLRCDVDERVPFERPSISGGTSDFAAVGADEPGTEARGPRHRGPAPWRRDPIDGLLVGE